MLDRIGVERVVMQAGRALANCDGVVKAVPCAIPGDLIAFGPIGHPHAEELAQYVAEALHIRHADIRVFEARRARSRADIAWREVARNRGVHLDDGSERALEAE